jgi:hypothetical protein
MDIKTKTGRELSAGDLVVTEGGETVRLTSVLRGMVEGCNMVEWIGGWGHVGLRDKVEVK